MGIIGLQKILAFRGGKCKTASVNETASGDDVGSVGANIRRTRLKRKMSVRAFGLLIERDPSIVWRWETGRQTPSMPMLQKIATVLEVSYLELIAGTEYSA